MLRRFGEGASNADRETEERESEQLKARHRAELDELGYAQEPVWTEVGVRTAMSGMPMTKPEYCDQWILISTAVAGIVLLALSWLFSLSVVSA